MHSFLINQNFELFLLVVLLY